jgi:AraC family transcriptional regulator of adaptative response/methylated-DNA-[protein]-cysteine methyltransferase
MDTAIDSGLRRMAEAILYLAEHHASQPSLEQAAAHVGLSPFYFHRVFTQYAGISPKDFIQHLTLEQAKRSLRAGGSVMEAAYGAGLSGPSRLHDLTLKCEAMTPGAYARGGEGLTIHYGSFDSLFGRALLMATSRGLCGLAFAADGGEEKQLIDMRARWPQARFMRDEAALETFAVQIFTQGKGELPIQLFGSPWQIKVWQALLAIPEGSVTSYRAVAQSVCDVKAARAVGAAIGRNPVALLIPCHRVLAASGALTGYHWGIARKRAMLALEAARQDTRKAI